jgi:arginine N-succinyltransferase
MYENFIIRPVEKTDLDDIEALALSAGKGLTNLPKDRDLLREKIEKSVASFSNDLREPDAGYYMFVLEDLEKKKVVGCSGIFAEIGTEIPSYSFKLSRELIESFELGVKKENKFLQLVNDYEGVTEIGVLYLAKDYRKNKLGQFLSRCRFLYMADNCERFHKKTIAEMRGIIDEDGKSPFWHALGKRFIELKFDEADIRMSNNKKRFVSELMPRTPIPVLLLDPKAQEVIGKPQKETMAAMHMLEKENFEYNNYIDIFDGGPNLEATTKFIRTIRKSRYATVADIKKKISGDIYMLGNCQKQYKMCLAPIEVLEGEEQLVICENTANKLGLKVEDEIRFIKFKE